ncbi:hypothetical protein FQA39_LY14467 [Lamprigera yunnana]|nr:hypothetical protein FQA39_LY14467 [Lamprigera yunnana]
MKSTVHCFLLLLLLITFALCVPNNVCKTYKDYLTIQTNPNCWYDVAADENATTIIKSYGYGVEIHKVTSPDGYITTLHRIINNTSVGRRVPVLLQHGFLNSGACFIGLGKVSLGFMLADAGYDVWLSNSRGSEYSEEHTTITHDDIRFWNYNSDDISLKDIPSILNYITIRNSQNGKIIYIGHSLGGSVALCYASSFPQKAKELVKLFILMAPAAGLENTKSTLVYILRPIISSIVDLFINTNSAKLLSTNAVPTQFIRTFCRRDPFVMSMCINLANVMILGAQSKTEASMVPIILNQYPAGSSLKVLKQLVDASRLGLTAYNYGLKNFEIYKSLLPPVYNITKINVPIYIIHSTADWAVTVKDSENLYNQLSPQAKTYGKYKITAKDFNHSAFLFSKSSKLLVYDKLLRLLESIRNQ